MPRVVANEEWIPFGDAKAPAAGTGAGAKRHRTSIGRQARAHRSTFLVLPEFHLRLIMDSGQFGMLRDQQLQKGAEQAFTPDADVMHELEEAQVQR